MNQQEILEYNKRCAEFLGYEISENKECFKLPTKNGWINLNIFHSDWNWIMEVVEAIEKVADWTLECLNYSDGSRNYQMMIPLSNTNVIFKDKKEAVVQAINQFLIWYKENKT